MGSLLGTVVEVLRPCRVAGGIPSVAHRLHHRAAAGSPGPGTGCAARTGCWLHTGYLVPEKSKKKNLSETYLTCLVTRNVRRPVSYGHIIKTFVSISWYLFLR